MVRPREAFLGAITLLDKDHSGVVNATGARIKNVNDPADGYDLVTKRYVDGYHFPVPSLFSVLSSGCSTNGKNICITMDGYLQFGNVGSSASDGTLRISTDFSMFGVSNNTNRKILQWYDIVDHLGTAGLLVIGGDRSSLQDIGVVINTDNFSLLEGDGTSVMGYERGGPLQLFNKNFGIIDNGLITSFIKIEDSSGGFSATVGDLRVQKTFKTNALNIAGNDDITLMYLDGTGLTSDFNVGNMSDWVSGQELNSLSVRANTVTLYANNTTAGTGQVKKLEVNKDTIALTPTNLGSPPDPVAGTFLLYTDGTGNLLIKGPAGTVTTLAVA